MRRAVNFVVALAFWFGVSPRASAEGPERVTFGAIDGSVVRVFALGSSRVAIEEADGQQIPVADPIAGHGTGFFVTSDGLIMTAFHVVDGAQWLAVRLPGSDGALLPARVLSTSEADDVAVLEVVSTGASPLSITESPSVAVRSTVFAVGYPIDATRRSAQSSRGIVAGLHDDGRIQLDIALNPGNSGGPLVDEQDRVVGLVVARGDVDSGVQNIGFAVPVDRLQPVLLAASLARQLSSTGGYASAAEIALVDELIQHGSLGEIHVDAYRHVTVEGDLGANVVRLAEAVSDPDLKVTAAGFLWNAALVLLWNAGDVANVTGMSREQMGQQVFGLIEHANRLAEAAIALDPTLTQRSDLARMLASIDDEDTSAHARTQPSGRDVDRSPRGVLGAGIVLRYNGNTGSLGYGGSVFGLGHVRLVRGATNHRSIDLAIGASVSVAMVDVQGETALHFDAAPEIGVGARFGRKGLGGIVGLTWAPGLYAVRLHDSLAGETYTDTAFDATGMHLYAGLSFQTIHVGVGARLISGVLWAEPLRFGFAF